MPTDIDQLERRATQLEIEKQALKKEDDPNSKERLAVIDKELAEIRERSNTLKANWKKEKDLIGRTRELKEKIDQLRTDEQAAVRKGDYNRASEIQYGEVPRLQAELTQLTTSMDGKSKRMLKEEVDEEDVARIVS